MGPTGPSPASFFTFVANLGTWRVNACRHMNASPFDSLDPTYIRAQSAALRSLALSITRHMDVAEDSVQDAWLAVLQPKQRSIEVLPAWLAAATRRGVMHRMRADRRREERERRAAPRRHDEPSSDYSLEQDEMASLLGAAVAGLPVKSREAIVMHFYESASPAEVARRTGVPLATVYSRLRRGLEELRQRLLSEEGGRLRERLLAFSGTSVVEKAPLWRRWLKPSLAGLSAAMVLVTLDSRAEHSIVNWALGKGSNAPPQHQKSETMLSSTVLALPLLATHSYTQDSTLETVDVAALFSTVVASSKREVEICGSPTCSRGGNERCPSCSAFYADDLRFHDLRAQLLGQPTAWPKVEAVAHKLLGEPEGDEAASEGALNILISGSLRSG